jgi:hypothetical protein
LRYVILHTDEKDKFDDIEEIHAELNHRFKRLDTMEWKKTVMFSPEWLSSQLRGRDQIQFTVSSIDEVHYTSLSDSKLDVKDDVINVFIGKSSDQVDIEKKTIFLNTNNPERSLVCSMEVLVGLTPVLNYDDTTDLDDDIDLDSYEDDVEEIYPQNDTTDLDDIDLDSYEDDVEEMYPQNDINLRTKDILLATSLNDALLDVEYIISLLT